MLTLFKLLVVPASDLVGHFAAGDTSARLLDVGRYATILQALAREAWSLGPWVLAAVAGWLVLCRQRCIALPFVITGGMLLGYLAIYLLASPNLEWHLSSSLQRLLLQLLPTLLFGVFLGTRGK